MIKDAIIAILIGFLVAGKITPPENKASVAVALSLAFIVFILVLWLDDLWNQHQKKAKSWIRWKKLQLKTWPKERAGRQRRRKMMQEYVQGLQNSHREEYLGARKTNGREKKDYSKLEEVTEHGDSGNTQGTD